MKEIPGYEGLFALTEDGKVWSYPKKIRDNYYSKGRWLIPDMRKNGYVFYTLKRKTYTLIKLLEITYDIKNKSFKIPNEEIKDIPGFEGRYAITKTGKVWSYPHELSGSLKGKGKTKGKWLKPSICYHGYPNVYLGANNSYRVHRLVALTYIENLENKKCINHKNSNRSDNRVENLEWVTHKENTIHSIEHGGRKKTR